MDEIHKTKVEILFDPLLECTGTLPDEKKARNILNETKKKPVYLFLTPYLNSQRGPGRGSIIAGMVL